ncbi:MAG: hypothetical protein K1X67_15115 [Fimbriimonadaceae bacterium]|nr:hypothetical protein [Fimbriimonadaceae bacterium]
MLAVVFLQTQPRRPIPNVLMDAAMGVTSATPEVYLCEYCLPNLLDCFAPGGNRAAGVVAVAQLAPVHQGGSPARRVPVVNAPARHNCRTVPSSPFIRYAVQVAKWCTVSVTDSEGRRYSLDVLAASSFDAAHLYVTHVAGNPACGLPVPSVETRFDVVAGGRIHRVSGTALKGWIEKRRWERKGPRGMLFKQRPMISE